MANDDEDSFSYSPSYRISLPAIQTSGYGLQQQGYGGGTGQGGADLDPAAQGPWREETDPETGSTFYYNALTFESRWERPAEMTTAAAGSNGTAADRIVAREDQNPSILSSPQSPTNGNVSLVNLVPALMRAKRRWRALVDGDTGSTYYIDQATGVSQWERPPPEEITQSADDVVVDDPILTPSTEHRKEENHSLVTVVPALMRAKRRWLALVDDSTGSTYYVDEATGTTQWEKPPEVDQGGSEEDEKKAASYPQEVASGAVMGGLDESENQARAAPEIDTTTERSGDALVRSSVSEDEKKATTSGGAGEVPLDKDIQGGVDGDPFLQRADSSSTLSTYGGELEFLAKYVTGHSTTLDRGTIVDVDLSKNEGGAGGKREEGGERISDTGEETVQSTDPSNENNGSAAESEIVADAGKSSTHSESSTPNSVDVRGAPSISEDSGSPSAEDSSRREPQPGVQPGESATDGTSSSSIQSIGQQHTLDVLMENTSRLEKPSQIDADYSSGCDGGAEPAVEVHDRPATSDDKSPSAPAEPKGGEVRARTASAVEGFGVEGIEERAPGQYGKDSSSVPSPTNGLDEADGNSIEEAWSNTSGAGKTLSTEVTEASTALLAKGHAPVPSALISGNNNESNAVQLVERSGDDPPQQHTVITAASAAVAKSPLPFDTAAVTIVALERLKAGMRLRQQREASVKLQANARGWVARRVCARLAERRETRRREERDAKQRAATAIQSMVRGRAGRNKAQRARHTRTEQGIQQAQLETTGSAALDREESTSQRGDESVDRLLHVGPAVCHLSSEGTDQSDEIRAPGSGVPPETSVPLANGSTVALEKEEYVTQPRKEEDFRGDGSHHDSVDPSAMEWSEVAAISREAKPSDPGQHQRHGGHEQDVFSPQLGEYVGTEGRFEPGPLGTIDEEGPQRNEHLWGGGGTEEPEPEHSVQTYSEYGTGPLGAQRTDAGVSFGSPELARKADTVQKSSPSSSETLDNDCDEITAQTNSPRSSETSGDDFDEEPSSDDREYDTDSIERRYDGSSRTSLSSKTATTTARNSSSTGAENTASGSHGDSRSLSDDGDLHPARDQSSTVWTEEEWVAQHHQQPADNDNAGQASEEFGGSESSAESQKAGAGVYLDATAPMDRLEDLRSLVAAQAQATARATMAAVGTEVFRREASRIRDLADRQAQVTDSFRDAVRHSIAVDAGDGEHSSCSVTSGSPSGLEAVPVTSPPERAGPEGGVAGGQPTEKQVVDQGDQSGRTPDGDDQAHTRRSSSWNDIGDGSANPPGDLRRTAVDLGAADDLPETNVSTDRAACVLGSDVSRLAARLGAAACELLRVSSSEAARKEAVVLDPRKDPRKDPEVHGALAALGQAVGLQAKAVGLMEEVIVRTVHSRLDARVAARAARKERAGRLAASLAEDVKLVAARHQNAARRMEAAPDPATARHVADDIRRLTLVQEKLAYKVQRYILSTSAALFNDDDNRQEKGAGDLVVGALEAPVAAEGKSHEAMMDEDITPEIAEADITAPAETETPQERLGKLATAAVKELRKGVDVGSVAAARAQAIRRGSQAGRLADELRLIASGQVAASSALAAAGEQLAADAMAEKPGPRDYTLPPRTRTRARRRAGVRKPASKSRGDSQILEDVVAGQRAIKEPGQGCGIITRNAGEPGSKQEATSDQGDDAVGGTASRDAEHFVGEGAGLPFATTDTAATAIETAAGLEEVAAAARIQSFLRRRRRQTRPDETGPLPVRSASSSVVEPSSDDQRSTDSTAEWFGAALRRLRGEVDSFLLGDEPQKDPGGAGRSEATPSQDAGDQTQEPELESRSVASRLSNADDGGRTDDDTADTRSSSESSGYDNDDDWPTFAPVPLRARAPSLYTLPAPGSSATSRRRTRDVDGDDLGAACSSRSTTAAEGQGGVFTKLGPEVGARLSSARSVFGLRAADVLAAFSPPPPPPCSSCPLSAFAAKPRDTTLSERPFTVPAPTIGIGDRLEHRGYGRLSSPDALRLRLRREAEDASRAGFGRPWLLSSRRQREPTRHRQQQEQLAAIVRARNRARGLRGGVEDGRETRRRLDFFGSWTPLGRRLAKRYNAGLAARRRRVLGETDQFRARHVGRQLRSGAVTSALEGVERALDLRLSVRREKRVPPAHVTELLDVFDRYVLSDSQLCEKQRGATPKPLDEVEVEGTGPRQSRCSICQELLGDLLQKHPVVRDQCSWGDDTNPFCCGRCSESSPVPGPPEEAESVVVLPLVDSQGEINSSSRVSGDEALGATHPQALASGEGERGYEQSAPVSGIFRLDEDQIEKYGAAPAPASNATDRLPHAAPSTNLPESAEEDLRAIGPVRGLGVRDDGAGAGLHPTQTADDVAAAFSMHLRGVDKYPLELARLCRFAQFLTENELLGEAYEVLLHILSSFAVVANNSSNISNRRAGTSLPCSASISFSPLPLPSGLNAQLLLVAGRLAVAIGRYPEAVRHVKAAVRAATHSDNVASRESPSILVSCSRVLEYVLDDRSAEIVLLGCILQYPDYQPALSSYGKLAARQGELGVAERYLTRAASLSSGSVTTTAKAGEWRTMGASLGCGSAEGWLVLMDFYSKHGKKTARAADALSCFRKTLNCLDWRRLEHHPRAAGQTSFSPSSAITGALEKTTEPPSSSSPSSTEEAYPRKPSAGTLLELGRFELLQNRNVGRALGLFRACLKESPWHASAKMHLSVCMLEQLGPIKDDRPPSRAVSRIDSLLRSALSCHFDGQPEPFLATPQAPRQQTTPKPLPPSTPTPHDVRRQRATRLQVNSAETNYPNNNLQTDGDVPSSPPRGSPISPAATKPGNRGRGAWLLWAFYAKFAERCLRDPRLAMYALEAAAGAAAAATSSPWVGRGRDRRKRGAGCGGGHGEGEVEGTPSNRGRGAPSLPLVARAQFCRRWPELFDDLAGGSTAGFSNGGAPSPPGELLMLTHALERYPNDPAALAALGYVLLSNSGGSRDDNHGFGGLREVENLDRAIAAFRRARGECHADCPPFLPAARGLAVATRRRRLMIGGAKRDELWPLGAAGDANVNINSGGSPQEERIIQEEENPRYLLQSALQECAGARLSVALLRTAAIHLYTWRVFGNVDIGTYPTTAPSSTAPNRAADERQAEVLLSRAVELEPFHVPTMVTLAFVLLQKSGGGGGGSGRAISRAEDLLQKAIECSGRTVPSEILRTLAQIRAHRGRRSSAISLFRRAVNAAAAATDTSADDPLSLCGLAQILLAPYHRRRSCPPRARRLPCAGQGEDDGQTSNGCSGTATAAARPETDAAQPTTLTASAKAAQPTGGAPASAMEEEVPLIFPNDEEKSEAARLFARAFSSAGGVVPPEDVYFGSQADDVAAVRTCGDDGAVDRGMAREERDLVTLAEVHLAVSGFTLREGWRGRGSGNAAKEWHLQEAARVAPPDAKAGIIARYILGRQTLAAGDDKQAEKLFLEALDAEPTTFGGCAAMLSALRQVAVDVFQAKVKLRRLNRRLVKRHKGRRRGVGGAAQKEVVVRLSRKVDASKRSVRLLEHLQQYASLRKRHARDLLRGPALANLEWALALEEGWEARYTRLLEAGDGWAAMHCLQQD